MSLYHLLTCKNEKIQKLAKEIVAEQKVCSHEFSAEYQNYNIYTKRCKKCGYRSITEY